MLDQFIQDAASDANVPDRVTALRTIAALLVKVKDQTTRELYAGQLAGILKMDPQQVRRAHAGGRRGDAAAGRARTSPRRPPRPPPGRRAARRRRPAARLPAEELELLVVLARYPELLRTPEAARAGDLLVHPLARQLYRAAAEQAAADRDAGHPGLARDGRRWPIAPRSRRRWTMTDSPSSPIPRATCGNW